MDAMTAGTAATTAYAGFWRRLGASFIDGIVLGIISFILELILGTAAGWLVGFLVSAAYFGWFHGTTGQTPGDAALSIRVVDESGSGTIGIGRALIRWIVSYVSGVVILIGYLWMLWDGRNQTWHDKAAKSVVVPA